MKGAKAKLPATVFTYTFGIITALVTGVGMCLSMNVVGNGTTSAFVMGVVIGIIGLFGMGVNYPIYKKMLKKGRQRYAFDIIELAKEVSGDQIMKHAKMILKRMFHPPKWVLFFIPMISYAALIFIFAAGETESALAYPVYCMSAYSLCILLVAVPTLAAKMKAAVWNSRPIQNFLCNIPYCRRYSLSLRMVHFHGGLLFDIGWDAGIPGVPPPAP